MKTSPVEGSGTAAPVDLSAAIEHWMADGIITAEQATRMRADLNEPLTVPPGGSPAPVPVPRTSRAALVTEALGYLGGVIILVALGLVVGHVWDQLSVGVRLALVGVVTVLLLVAGSLIPARLGATGVRLRSVLWFASSAAFAAFLGLCASELAGWADETQAMFAALGAALYLTVLWWAHRHLLQQVAVFVPLLAGVGTGVSLLPDAGALPGLAVWGVSVAWLALAWVGSSRAARSERCWVRSGRWGPRPRWWARAGAAVCRTHRMAFGPRPGARFQDRRSRDEWHYRRNRPGAKVEGLGALMAVGARFVATSGRRAILEPTMSSKNMARMSRRTSLPPAWTSVLAVIAHPDDASSGLGAILDAFVFAGARVARVEVLCLTHGQAWMLDEAPGDLATLRGAELASAADVLGPIRFKMEDCPDGALGEGCRAKLATEVVAIADSCHPDGLLVFDAPAVTGHLDHAAATSIALLAAETLDRPVLGWTLSETVAAQLNQESGAVLTGRDGEMIDLRVTFDRARQRLASHADAGPALPGSARRRRLELLAETESLRWLRT